MKEQQGLDDIILIAEAKYPINFTESRKSFVKRFVLNPHYKRSNSFLFLMLQKHTSSKQEILKSKMMHCSGKISKDFSIFSVDFNPIGTNGILDTYKYFMKIS